MIRYSRCITMKPEEVDISTELSFILEFDLNRAGMIEEIKTEFDIIRMCITQLDELGKDYVPMIDRLLVMPLRKLLCDKNSVLLKIVPNLKLPPIGNNEIDLKDGLKIIHPNLSVEPQEDWIPIKKWRKQVIARIEKSASDLPAMYPAFAYKIITTKLNRMVENRIIKPSDQQRFNSYFELKRVFFNGNEEDIFMRIDPTDSSANSFIFSLLKKAGYYDLTINEFIKHLSNKRGAHIDIGHSAAIELVNDPISELVKPTTCISLQMIWAVKHQVPELMNYWPEMKLNQV